MLAFCFVAASQRPLLVIEPLLRALSNFEKRKFLPQTGLS